MVDAHTHIQSGQPEITSTHCEDHGLHTMEVYNVSKIG